MWQLRCDERPARLPDRRDCSAAWESVSGRFMPRSDDRDTMIAFDDVEVMQEGALALVCRVRGKIVSIPRAQAVKRPARGDTGSLVIPRSLARERGLI